MSGLTSNALAEAKLRLVAPPHEKAVVKYDRPQQPTLTVRVKDNQPRLVVYTNVEGDKDNGKIEAALDAPTFYAIAEAIGIMADNPDAEPLMFECKNYVFVGGKRSDKPLTVCHVVLARDRNTGALSICLKPYDKSRPLIPFAFGPTEWHNVCDRNGAVVPTQEYSRLYAKGWAGLMKMLVASVLVTEHVSAEELRAKREANRAARGGGNGGGGNYNRGNNNNGGYNQRPAAAPAADDVDNDIPW